MASDWGSRDWVEMEGDARAHSPMICTGPRYVDCALDGLQSSKQREQRALLSAEVQTPFRMCGVVDEPRV